MAATAVIVFFGVEKGVEKVSKIMMPVLVVLTLGIAIYVITLPGAMKGVVYYLKPNFANFRVETVLAAMGQLFYSMSLAMGIMITYGSYMKKEVAIENSVRQISLFDTGIAFLAGLMIVPACVAYDPTQISKGPGLMFGVLPKIFDNMPGGAFVGAAFFLMVLLAALTSSISLMETVVSTVQDRWKLGRRLSVCVVLVMSLALGLLSCLGYSAWSGVLLFGKFQFLDFFDFITNSVMMPIVALLTCIFITFVIKTKAVSDEVALSGRFKMKRLFDVMIPYVAPICLVVILVFAMLEGFGIITV
jgi:NSS family neurotransmitter:Na+ symporter